MGPPRQISAAELRPITVPTALIWEAASRVRDTSAEATREHGQI
jgi:hypothetical protein